MSEVESIELDVMVTKSYFLPFLLVGEVEVPRAMGTMLW